MTTETALVTAAQLLAMPDDGLRRELIRGEIRTMAPAGHQHGRIAHLIGLSLGMHVAEHRLGQVYAAETGFKLASNPDHVRAPDAAFVRAERVAAVRNSEGFFPGAPDLAVEVVSPGDAFVEVEEKVFDWLQAGSHAVIVINPKHRSATVYRSFTDVRVLSASDTLALDEIVPGWRLPVAELFD